MMTLATRCCESAVGSSRPRSIRAATRASCVALLAVLAPIGLSARPASADRRNPLDPFHTLAQAPATQPAATPVAQPAAAPATQPAPGASCQTDADCAEGTYCEQNRCVSVQFRVNIAYLYYRSAGQGFTEAGGIYWHQRGASGYRVVAPFYWHFWRPELKLRIFAPFYWHAEDLARRLSTTVVPPVQWGSAPGEGYFRLWPLLFVNDYGEAGSSVALLPLFYRERRGPYSAFAFPLGFNVTDRERQRSYGQALLYYWYRSPEKRADAVWPLFYASRGPRHATVWAAPLNFYWRRGDSTHFLGFPFAYYGADRESSLSLVLAPPIVSYRSGDYRLTTVPPLFWRFGTPERRRTWLLPLVYAGHHGSARHFVLFPLFWHLSRPGTHTTVLANAWYHRDSDGYSAAFLPFAFFGADRKEGVSHATVLPLFHYSTEKHGRRRFFISLLGLHESDRDARASYTLLFAPPYYHRRDPEREIDTLIPLYLRWKARDTGTTVQAITPLFWTRRDAEGSTQVLFPALWRFTARRERIATTVLLPIFYRYRSPERSTTVVATGYYHRDERGWDAGLAPLLFAGGGKDHRYGVLFPWLWHFANDDSATTVAAPFYYKHGRRGWLAGVAPLLFAGNYDGERHFVLFPLAWHFASRRESTSTSVIGPVFWSRSRTGYQAGVAPLVFFGRSAEREHQVVAPLFFRFVDRTRDDETVVAGPFYHHRVGSRLASYGLFPLVHYRRETGPPGISLTVLPLFHYQSRPGRELALTPLGGYLRDDAAKRRTLVVGPFVQHRAGPIDATVVVPLFGRWHDARDRSVTTFLLPFGVHRRSPTHTRTVVFPFVWYFREPGETDLTIFPFYSRIRSAALDADVGFPLYWSVRTPERRTHVIGPGFYTRGLKAESRSFGVLPLFMYSGNPKREYALSLPFIYFRRSFTERRTLTVVGPFFAATYPDGYAGGLLPLGFIRDRGRQRQVVVLPIVWHFSNAETDVHTNVVGPVLYRRNGGARTYGLLPFFFVRTRPGLDSVTLLPLFHVASGPERLRILTPVAGVSRGRGVGPDWGYVGPFWWLRKSDWSADGLLPVMWRFHDLARQRHTFVFFPLWYSQTSPERAFHVGFPLFWRSRRIDGATTVVLPLYFDANRYYEERTTVLLPFGWRHYSAEDDTTRWAVIPSIYVRQRHEATDAFFFPLLWHWGGRERSTTVVAPLYWDFKRGDRRNTIFFPLVWRFGRKDADTWVVLNTYYRAGKGKHAGTYRFIFIPLFEVSRPRPKDFGWEVLGGLVGFSRVGRNRILRLFWRQIWLEPAAPAPAAPRTSRRAPQRSIRMTSSKSSS